MFVTAGDFTGCGGPDVVATGVVVTPGATGGMVGGVVFAAVGALVVTVSGGVSGGATVVGVFLGTSAGGSGGVSTMEGLRLTVGGATVGGAAGGVGLTIGACVTGPWVMVGTTGVVVTGAANAGEAESRAVGMVTAIAATIPTVRFSGGVIAVALSGRGSCLGNPT